MTKTGLERLFDGLAGVAKQYDVRDTVLRKAARRRRVVRLAPAAVAVALVLGVGAVWVPLHGGDRVPAADPSATSWLPRQVDGDAAAQPLPADRPVAPGALLYRSAKANGYEYSLLTTDGRYYDPPQPVTTLSPDGRWLGYRGEDGYVLRDLTGTTVRSIPKGYLPLSIYVQDGLGGTAYTNRFGIREWSSDNRWLLLAEDSQETNPPFTFYRYDLTTGAVEQIGPPMQLDGVLAVLPTGEVLVQQVDLARRLVTVVAVDPLTGAQRNRTTIDMNEYIPPGGYLQGRNAGLDGTSLLIEWTDAEHAPPRKALYVDLTTGQRRPIDIRPQDDEAEDWWVHTVLPGGIVITERHPTGGFVLRLVDTETGKQRVVCTLRNLGIRDLYAMQVRGT